MSDALTPTEIRRLGTHAVRVVWTDGHVSEFRNDYLRDALPVRRLPRSAAAQPAGDRSRRRGLYPVQIGLVGRYAISIQWSDGHDTGIYSYQTLRALCPCATCAARERAPSHDHDRGHPRAAVARCARTACRATSCRAAWCATSSLRDGVVVVQLQPGPLPPPILDATVADIRRAVGALAGVTRGATCRSRAPRRSQAIAAIPGVGDIIAVTQHEGRRRQVTVAMNLACALQQRGLRVGLLDADVYGPSLPTMLGISGRPAGHRAEHASSRSRSTACELMSMGFFLDDSSPVIWRGPLVTGLVRQFLKDVQLGRARCAGGRPAAGHGRRAS